MNSPQPQPTDQPAGGAQLVELQPVFVFTAHIGRMIAALRRANIYYQFGPRRGQETIFFVLPTDLDAALNIASLVSGPLAGSGCNPRLILIAGVILALVAGIVLLVTAFGLGV